MSADSTNPAYRPADTPPAGSLDLPTDLRIFRRRRLKRAALLTPAPRFGTYHLLLWLGMTCAYLATNRDLYAGALTPGGMLLTICLVLPRGAAWAGLALLVEQLRRRSAALADPGLWLAAIAGAMLVAETAWKSGPLSMRFRDPETLTTALASFLLISSTLSVAIPLRWRILFMVLAAIGAWPLIVEFLLAPLFNYRPWLVDSAGILAGYRYSLAALGVFAAVIGDFRRRLSHGWLHWVGLADVLLILLTSAVANIILNR